MPKFSYKIYKRDHYIRTVYTKRQAQAHYSGFSIVKVNLITGTKKVVIYYKDI